MGHPWENRRLRSRLDVELQSGGSCELMDGRPLFRSSHQRRRNVGAGNEQGFVETNLEIGWGSEPTGEALSP